MAIELRPVSDVAARAADETARVFEVIRDLGLDAEVRPFGATAWPDGLTKGDIDVLVRVRSGWVGAVGALRTVMLEAQRQNWTDTFASFTDDGGDQPVGVQVVLAGSEIDHVLLDQLERLADPAFRRRYDDVKRHAAPLGAQAYWQAKDAFWADVASGNDPLT